MKTVNTTSQVLHSTTESKSHLFGDWFDPIETGIRDRVRGLIEEMIRASLTGRQNSFSFTYTGPLRCHPRECKTRYESSIA
jgi:hypothetical protein